MSNREAPGSPGSTEESSAPPRESLRTTRRRLWLRLIGAALFLAGLAFLTGTSTGRLRAYSVLFALGSTDLQEWTADRIREEPLEKSLPVVFDLLSDPDFAPPFENNNYLRERAIFRSFKIPLEEWPFGGRDRASLLLISAAIRSLGPDSELLRRPAVIDILMEVSARPRPELRALAIVFLAEHLDTIRPASPRVREGLRRIACEDPTPLVRVCALDALKGHDLDFDFLFARLDREQSFLVRGQILESLHEAAQKSKPSAAQRERIITELIRFWPERVRQACEAAGIKPGEIPNYQLPETGIEAYGEEGTRRALAWIRDHPADVFALSSAIFDREGPMSPELVEAVFAFMRANPSPSIIQCVIRLMAEEGLAPESQDALGAALAAQLTDPTLREALGPRFELIRDHPQAAPPLAILATSKDPLARFNARCLFNNITEKPLAFRREELFAAATSSRSGLWLKGRPGFTGTVFFWDGFPGGSAWPLKRPRFGEAYSRDGAPMRIEQVPPPTAAERRKRTHLFMTFSGSEDLPALLPGLRACSPAELDRVLPELRLFERDEVILKGLAREPGVLGEKARALLQAKP